MPLVSNVTTQNYLNRIHTEGAPMVPRMEGRTTPIQMNKASYGTGPPKCAVPVHTFSISS